MPNTPALVGEGMSALCPNEMVTEKDLEDILNIFKSFGQTEIVNEKLMDVVTSVSGSSPAYVYMFIEAMADAAVLDGMPRNQAYKFAAQAVLGSAKMVLETGIHPGELKDMVCSPGGTTIEAVATLEEKGLRTAIISAMKRCTQKSMKMSSLTSK
ncbi:Pyrroline-5-carboxylate reductase [Bacillus cereus Rock3-44]|nr:Pyrroline-5-carboxylate reductase [Bacillus cereus Rock3-44]